MNREALPNLKIKIEKKSLYPSKVLVSRSGPAIVFALPSAMLTNFKTTSFNLESINNIFWVSATSQFFWFQLIANNKEGNEPNNLSVFLPGRWSGDEISRFSQKNNHDSLLLGHACQDPSSIQFFTKR